MERAWIMEVGWALFFQILNTAIVIGIVFVIFYIVIKLPKRLKQNEERVERIEKTLDEINRKIDTK